MELPSIEQCRTFLATINRGREAIGLHALERLDFDECDPGSTCNCLSAHHVFDPAGFGVDQDYIWAKANGAQLFVGPALGLKPLDQAGDTWRLSPEILAVTDVFDACEDNPELLKALRERMVEAGVV